MRKSRPRTRNRMFEGAGAVNIPPLVRTGPVPPPSKVNDRTGYVVLVAKRGWIIARWHTGYGVLLDVDRAIPEDWRWINPSDVLCWMPEDGS